jgi:YD repeat-containing protein
MLQSVTGPPVDGNPTGYTSTYTYDSVGRRLTMVDPNGNASGGGSAEHTWTYSYDNEDRLTVATAPAPSSGGTALKTQTQYDAVGNRTVLVDGNGQVTTYEYDVRDSLQKVHQSPDTWQLANPNLPLKEDREIGCYWGLPERWGFVRHWGHGPTSCKQASRRRQHRCGDEFGRDVTSKPWKSVGCGRLTCFGVV